MLKVTYCVFLGINLHYHFTRWRLLQILIMKEVGTHVRCFFPHLIVILSFHIMKQNESSSILLSKLTTQIIIQITSLNQLKQVEALVCKRTLLSFYCLFSTRNYAQLVLLGVFFVSIVWQFKLLDYHVRSSANTWFSLNYNFWICWRL